LRWIFATSALSLALSFFLLLLVAKRLLRTAQAAAEGSTGAGAVGSFRSARKGDCALN